ncbi:UNVERIFIED_CONTAM: hypothetical protein K2H54_050312 [Gekko kuhli]
MSFSVFALVCNLSRWPSEYPPHSVCLMAAARESHLVSQHPFQRTASISLSRRMLFKSPTVVLTQLGSPEGHGCYGFDTVGTQHLTALSWKGVCVCPTVLFPFTRFHSISSSLVHSQQ